MQVSALLGRIPSAVGYQPTLATDMGTMQERITTTKKGSITSVQAVFVPADDLTDPAPATTFAHLDATTVLSRAISGGWSNDVIVSGNDIMRIRHIEILFKLSWLVCYIICTIISCRHSFWGKKTKFV